MRGSDGTGRTSGFRRVAMSEASSGPSGGLDHAAWQAFCDALKAAGDRILEPDFPGTSLDRAEGFRHLAQQAACWLTWGVGHADASDPRFMRQNDLFTQWGGPNVDNLYKHARIDPTGVYRVRGKMHSCEEFLLAVRIGNMHEERYGTLYEVTATDMGIGPGDDFEITLGGVEPSDPAERLRWVPLPDEARMVNIREYYYDWREREPAVFVIERVDERVDGVVDGVVTPGRLTAVEVAGRLDEARSQFERSVVFWNDYQRTARGRGADNTFIQPRAEPKGLKGLVYAFCFYRLGVGEALVVESAAPVARYWSYQLYRLGWFEPVESVHRTGGLNQRQLRIDSDGRVRVVIAAEDPGVANWLDTGGREEGMLTFRCAWAENRPEPTARVVRVSDLAEEGFDPTWAGGPVSADERAEAVRVRGSHAAWRFRT
ncbi:DUF1214 domain-containing protein [Yinghuangia seranimata]|uniref:DUF1214 domain-containing protein n=1 Tax=Yinghuangia seranimata TaxID=408067 RepID=UPI00248B0D89|nr:DUF1214 domain-containing protein [Yinghuangia seranimata]MDI2129666.1 DUF1214 domain-containing protein [Yinghuangia seranimata]